MPAPATISGSVVRRTGNTSCPISQEPGSGPGSESAWYCYAMAARLPFREKHILPDHSIVEMVISQLPRRSRERPSGLKYSLYYGLADGTSVVRYDNESGKGDHRHCGTGEETYTFSNVERLVEDFLADVARARKPANE